MCLPLGSLGVFWKATSILGKVPRGSPANTLELELELELGMPLPLPPILVVLPPNMAAGADELKGAAFGTPDGVIFKF